MKIIEEIRREIDLAELVRSYGILLKKIGQNWQGLCPFHTETNPSFTVYPETQSYYCFGCKKGGDVINFLAEKEHISYHAALTTLAEAQGIKADWGSSLEKISKAHITEEILAGSIDFFAKRLANSDEALGYLLERGLDTDSIAAFKLGFAPSEYALSDSLRERGFEMEDILLAGIIRKGEDGALYNFFRNRIIFPHLKRGRVTYLAGRALPGNSNQSKYIKLPVNEYVNNGFFNMDALPRGNEKVIITEGYFDCIMATQNGFPAITPGGTQIKEDLLEELKGRNVTFQIVFDNENSGEGKKTALLLAEKFSREGIRADIVTLPKNESIEKVDLADFLLDHGKEELNAVLGAGIDFIDYQIQEISGLPEAEQVRQLKAVLIPLLSREDNLETERYLDHIKRILGLNTKKMDAIRKEIKKTIRVSEESQGFSPVEKPYEMTEEEKQEALAYLRNPNIFDLLKDDLILLGLVGEEKNALCLYLISISRKSNEPISAVVSAKSSSGKSYLVNTIAELTPVEDRLLITSASARSLDYLPEEWLQNKLLVVQEIDGMTEIMETIKLIQSEGKIARLTTYENPKTGKREIQVLNKNVALSVLTTTTRDRIPSENATRIFEIHVDESPEHTRDIINLNKFKATLEWHLNKPELRAVKERHHNVQRLLEPVHVVIPFSDKIEFPASAVRYRRDSARFLSLIKVVAFYRQHQKQKRAEGDITTYIEADIEDYDVAYQIGYDILKNTISEFSDKERLLIELALGLKQGLGCSEYKFTRRALRDEAMKKKIELPSEPTLNKVIKSLIYKDIFLLDEGQRGRKYVYQLGIDSLEEAETKLVENIISPQELRRRIEADHTGGGNG